MSKNDFFLEKEFWLGNSEFSQENGFFQVDSKNFYREIFPFGTFQEQDENFVSDGKGNGFLVLQDGEKKHTRMVFDDLEEIQKNLDNPCVFMSPIAYFGRNRTLTNARMMYAMVFDLDEVDSESIALFFIYHHDNLPRPTYTVNSGNGLHLYYVFDTPIPLYPNIQKSLKKLKYALTAKIWNGDTSKLEIKQYQGINQGFRLVGSRSKLGHKITAWKTGDKVTLEYLSSFVSPENRITDTIYHSKITLEEAKKKYPNWYNQRIEQAKPRGYWVAKRALYDWWKRHKTGAEHHHRYFYIMALTIYAVKCDIPFEELKKDAYGMQEYLNSKYPENPFTHEDIKSALEMYQPCYRTFPRDEIEKLTGIPIPKNKRNGQKQKDHLEEARAIRDIRQKRNGTNWRDNAGRKSAESIVFDWLKKNSTGTARQFCEETGLKKTTFYKYKKNLVAIPLEEIHRKTYKKY